MIEAKWPSLELAGLTVKCHALTPRLFYTDTEEWSGLYAARQQETLEFEGRELALWERPAILISTSYGPGPEILAHEWRHHYQFEGRGVDPCVEGHPGWPVRGLEDAPWEEQIRSYFQCATEADALAWSCRVTPRGQWAWEYLDALGYVPHERWS